MQSFKILVSFFSEETQSEYIEEMFYTARNQKLIDLVNVWVGEKKAEWTKNQVQVQGKE